MGCNNPLTRTLKNGQVIEVACRRCLGCLIERRRELTFRCKLHMASLRKKGLTSSFITLTYDPIYYKGGLCLRDVQLFNKRMRQYIKRLNDPLFSTLPYRYVLCGEMGSNTDRAHYHAMIFGFPPSLIRQALKECWKMGFVDVSELNTGRIKYVLKYMDKQRFYSSKMCRDEENEHYGLVYDKKLDSWIVPPFCLFSKGIGAEELKKLSVTSLDNGVLYDNGKPVKFPSYYAKKFGIDYEVLKRDFYEHNLQVAKRDGVSYHTRQVQTRYNNEQKAVANARKSNSPHSDYSLRIAKSNAEKKSFDLDSIIKEI